MDKKLRKRLRNRVVSIVAAMVLCMTLIPIYARAEESAGDVTSRITDEATLDAWKEYFSSQTVTTEYAGAVWTDKTVLTTPEALGNTDITLKDENSFLVALSAMGSTMNVTGMANAPTDTVFILDVSTSMNSSNNDVVEELVDAANTSIAALLKLNKHNRISVILYANGYHLVLPLNHYTAADGQFLTYLLETSGKNKTEYIGIDADVKIDGTDNKPTGAKIQVSGSTYIQKGIQGALEQLLATNNSTIVDGAKRTPILVLMSDGAPTLATTSFTDPASSNLGNGLPTSSTPELGFVTQLTLAFAKTQIEEKYDTKPYFYTMGLGVSNNDVATSVLDPAHSSAAINDFWNNYNKAKEDESIVVSGTGKDAKKVTKIATPLEQNSVNKFFNASGETGDLALELKKAFEEVVSAISLQSRYYPTLVTDSPESSGYVTFVDRLGESMEVIDIKGIFLGDVLLSESEVQKILVQVKTDSDTGETSVIFAIPASMLPVVSYNVNVNENGALEELTLTGAKAPIRLVYEVGLKDGIDETEVINYYTNQYEADGSIGYDKVNTYSYFNPSKLNDHYYYQKDEVLYSDSKGTLYTDTAKPTTGMYRAQTVYKNDNGTLSTIIVYQAVVDELLASAVWDGENGYWYISKGNVNVNHEDCLEVKTENKTGTLGYIAAPMIDITNHSMNDNGENYIVASVMGNNGKLIVTLAAGTEEPEVPEKPEIPNMGDNLMPVLYGLAFLLAGVGVIYTVTKLRKKEK